MTNAREYTAHLTTLLSSERGIVAEFLLTLAEFDRRQLWIDLGYANLFDYLHRELGLSRGAAHYRKVGAQLVQQYPEIVAPLRDGRLCITSIVELSKVITAENREAVLPRFFHRSKQEAKAVAAEIRPVDAPQRRDVVSVVRQGADRKPMLPALELAPTPGERSESAVHPDEPAHANAATVTQERRDAIEPLTADLRRLHFTVSLPFLAKLEAARAALSHSHPGATFETIFEVALDLVIARHAKRRGLVAKPRATARASKPERVAANVSRELWTRDGGRCQWKLQSGGICGSTVRVQNDHVAPGARGGSSNIGNLRLLCAFHNDLAARRVFGDEWMNQFTRKPGARKRQAARRRR